MIIRCATPGCVDRSLILHVEGGATTVEYYDPRQIPERQPYRIEHESGLVHEDGAFEVVIGSPMRAAR